MGGKGRGEDRGPSFAAMVSYYFLHTPGGKKRKVGLQQFRDLERGKWSGRLAAIRKRKLTETVTASS